MVYQKKTRQRPFTRSRGAASANSTRLLVPDRNSLLDAAHQAVEEGIEGMGDVIILLESDAAQEAFTGPGHKTFHKATEDGQKGDPYETGLNLSGHTVSEDGVFTGPLGSEITLMCELASGYMEKDRLAQMLRKKATNSGWSSRAAASGSDRGVSTIEVGKLAKELADIKTALGIG